MALSPYDKTKLTRHLATGNTVAEVRSTLKLGRLGNINDKRENFEILESFLASILIIADAAGVAEAAAWVGQQHGNQKAIQIDVLQPPPVDVGKLKNQLEDGSAFHAEIDGVWVSLDNDQMKHQPASVPIGTRVAEGEKFGTYATTAWHQTHTMRYMADWAKTLTGLSEGKSTYHGQARRIQIEGVGNCSFEGFCMLLGTKRYVQFHCYPNSH